jgi:uncharacterized membrane protein
MTELSPSKHHPAGKTSRDILMRRISSILFFVYPVLIYILLKYCSLRIAGLLLLIVLGVNYGQRMWNRPDTLKTVGVQAGGIMILVLLGVIFNHDVYILQLPVFINLLLLATFVISLVRPPCVIERYANLVQDDFTVAERRYYRQVTIVWSVFFVVNSSITEWIIWHGNLELWTLYVGAIAYVLMGMLFTIEYLVRKLRFKRFENRFPDTILRKMTRDTAE